MAAKKKAPAKKKKADAPPASKVHLAEGDKAPALTLEGDDGIVRDDHIGLLAQIDEAHG